VTDHVVLKPEGFIFAPHPAVTDTDRDKYCVHRIIDFYDRHKVDLVDYFLAAWKYQHRARLGRPDPELSRFAAEAGLSGQYLSMIWSTLTEAEAEVGPLAVVRKMWRELPIPSFLTPFPGWESGEKRACERMRDLVLRLRRQLAPKINRVSV